MASFGVNLRKERELRGVSLREIADSTKISVRFLDAIEHDRIEVLPGGLFPRAFVRQYARHLGLDAERLVAEFVYAHGLERVQRAETPAATAAAPSRWRLVVPLGLALAALPLLWPSAAQKSREREAQALPAVATPGPVFPPDRVYPPPSGDATKTAEPDGLVLTLSARQSCWVAAQVDGQPALNRVLNAGEIETIEAAGEIVLSVGNAGGLAFKLNDRPGLSLGKSGEVRRNIVISKKNLPTLVEDAPTARASHSS